MIFLRIALIIIVALLIGCASSHMKQYLNKDVREVAIDNGPPMNAFDMGDGRRVFQWRWGGGTYVIPETNNLSGNVTVSGNTAWYSATTIKTGGGTVSSMGCVLSYFAFWDKEKNAWVVKDYRVPKQLVC
ncbi:hypothetical protein [Colwellia sp. C1TZA3]|uniref:hypothetical protein n=1 Tax=Colwellia sp. C1TZA3 TaxID=2508879 RepID=UPI0011B9D560|nr:hypothetical protein [Colwellia sp. C1TZA3]TWX63190.1 hypothetical protein ESZ39_17195 [Colwellia sp. C1TZA3]